MMDFDWTSRRGCTGMEVLLIVISFIYVHILNRNNEVVCIQAGMLCVCLVWVIALFPMRKLSRNANGNYSLWRRANLFISLQRRPVGWTIGKINRWSKFYGLSRNLGTCSNLSSSLMLIGAVVATEGSICGNLTFANK